jgi:hypothetical protein
MMMIADTRLAITPKKFLIPNTTLETLQEGGLMQN